MTIRAYIRVSTDEQAEEGFSLPTQRQRITDFCRSQWGTGRPICWYEDDGYSAKDTERPHLQNLRREANSGDVIVVLRLDRLTRSVLDLYTLLKEWEDRGIHFRSVTEPYDTQRAEGRFMIGLLALLAEWERLRIAERVREVMAHTVRAERRHLSKPPMGYQLVAGRLQVDEAEAATVREIFAQYIRGRGTRAIALALNRKGLHTRQQAEWSDVSVAYVLRNPIYSGKVAWQRVRRRPGAGPIVVDGEHPPLVDLQTWAAAQTLLASRAGAPRRSATSSHSLTGLARCGECGGPIHGVTQQRYHRGQVLPDRMRVYYRCGRGGRKQTCRFPYLPGPALEQRVLHAMDPLASPETLAAIWQSLSKRHQPNHPHLLTELQARKRKLERACRRWDDAYAAGDLSREEWRTRVSEIQTQLREVTAQLDLLGQTAGPQPDAAAAVAAMSHLPDVWACLTPAERKTLLRGFLDHITIHPDGSVTLQPKYP